MRAKRVAPYSRWTFVHMNSWGVKEEVCSPTEVLWSFYLLFYYYDDFRPATSRADLLRENGRGVVSAGRAKIA